MGSLRMEMWLRAWCRPLACTPHDIGVLPSPFAQVRQGFCLAQGDREARRDQDRNWHCCISSSCDSWGTLQSPVKNPDTCGRDKEMWKRNKKVAVVMICSPIRGTLEGAMHHGLRDTHRCRDGRYQQPRGRVIASSISSNNNKVRHWSTTSGSVIRSPSSRRAT